MTMRDLQARLELLETEVRLLKRGQARIDAESVITFLEFVSDAFGKTSWTANRVFEAAEDNPFLYAALVRCLGGDPSIQGLGKFLMRSIGQWGPFRLRCIKPRSYLGAVFQLTHCVSKSGEEASRLQKD